MAIKVRCPGCRQKIRYNQAPHGSQGRCPRCSAVVLTMEDASDADATVGPAASHDAVVPGPRRHSRPEDDTVVFTPLFPSPVPVVAPRPFARATVPPRSPAVRLPARRAVLSRRGFATPRHPARPGSIVGDVASALAIAAMLGLSLVGASVLGLWVIVILTQFP